MSQETRSPIDVAGEYWATYNPKPKGCKFDADALDGLDLHKLITPGDIVFSMSPDHVDHLLGKDDLLTDPWVNGRYALAALVWGLIALVVLGVGAGP